MYIYVYVYVYIYVYIYIYMWWRYGGDMYIYTYILWWRKMQLDRLWVCYVMKLPPMFCLPTWD